jgi:hypothetical protein
MANAIITFFRLKINIVQGEGLLKPDFEHKITVGSCVCVVKFTKVIL